MQTLIKNGILYTMTEDKGIFQGDILVEGTKIKEVAEHISEDCLEDGDKLIEAEGYYVLPGLIDAHSHIGLFDFNVDPGVDDANEMTNPVTLSVDARFGTNPKAREFKVAYEHGITTMLPGGAGSRHPATAHRTSGCFCRPAERPARPAVRSWCPRHRGP